MKGIVFNIFEAFVIQNWGEEFYEEIIETSNLESEGIFVGPGNYPDTDLVELVVNTSKKKGIDVPDAIRAFGVFLFPQLAAAHQHFLVGYSHPKPFLMGLESVIHTEVKKLYSDAKPPLITGEDTGESELLLTYQSERNLPDLVEGLLEGVSKHFNVPIQSERQSGSKDGVHVFKLTFG